MSKEIDRNDFEKRMEALQARGISVPLTGEGDEFLTGVIKYALKNAQNYMYFYLPLKYKDVVYSDDIRKIIDKKGITVKGLLYGVNLSSQQEAETEKVLGAGKHLKPTDVVKFPFVIYDDEFFAVEDYDKNNDKHVWVANLRSENTVSALKEFHDRIYND